MSFELPPVVKLAERIMLEVELIVRHFPRYHKYMVGERLRDHAMDVNFLCNRAWFDKTNQARWLSRLVFKVDDFKSVLQLAKEVQAFKSFAQFEALARLVTDLGRQCGSWKRKQQDSGQNVSGYRAHSQRPQRLSARSASGEANP